MNLKHKIWVLLAAIWVFTKAHAQVVPEIVVNTPNPCVPGVVQLQMINCSSCISYKWQVGAGQPFKPGTDNYATIINASGWYDVTVIIETSSGAKTAISKKKAFLGRNAPAIKFTANRNLFCKGFDTLVLTDSTPNSVSRDWLVDGNIYYNGPKKLNYVLNGIAGYKQVYLMVRDSWQCQGSLVKDSFIGVWDSVLTTVTPSKAIGCAPAYVKFVPSFDSFNQIPKNYYWSFQGATPVNSALRNPSGIYYNKGDTFDVDLKLTTQSGCVYRYHYNNLLSFGDTQKLVISKNQSSVCAGKPFNVKVSGGKSKNPLWKVKGITTFSVDSLRGVSKTFKFGDTGRAFLEVNENDRGCISIAKDTSGIKVMGPVAKFISEYPYYCGVPKTLKYTNKSIEDPGGVTWNWSVKNSSGTVVSTGTSKDHSFTTNLGKDYDVILIASGANGCKDTNNQKNASIFGKIDTSFTIKPNPVCPGTPVKVTAAASAQQTTSTTFSYLWSFYDEKGNVVKTDKNPKGTYTYNKNGDYSVKLVISNSENCKDSLKLKDTIHVATPKATIYVPDTFACIGQVISAWITSKDKIPGLTQTWVIKNIDTVGVFPFRSTSDTIRFYLSTTGRYSVELELSDTSAGNCAATIRYPYLIKISGMKHAISASPTLGCTPLNTTYNSSLLYNVNYKPTTGTQKYMWRSNWAAAINFQTPTQKTTKASVVIKGNQGAYLVYQNESGCWDSTRPVFVQSGMDLGFYFSGNTACVGNNVQIKNNSSSWIQSYKYLCDSPSVVFTPSKTIAEPIVKFTKPGLYAIALVGYYNGCADTVATRVNIQDIQADFYTPDSVAFCAPKLINIINNTFGAVYNKWYFGDGDSITTRFNELAGHLYFKNKNDGYTVKLITQNSAGCTDTLEKKNYLRIVGPEPDFEIKNYYGCEELRVQFINKSKVYTRMFMDYDNGVVGDSVMAKYFDYYVADKTLKVQKYIPRLLLTDSSNCAALKVSDDTITVLKSPEANFNYTSQNFLRGTEGCANDLLVSFANRTKFFTKIWWDLDGDGIIDVSNQANPSFYYTKPGVFYPKIIAENFNLCRDTFSRDSFIVWEPPVAGWVPSTDSSCAIDPVKFRSTTTSKYPIVSYYWDFGELAKVDDTSTLSASKYRYFSPFNHYVTLDVVDQKGCKSQAAANVYIFDTAGPAAQKLAYITVLPNGQLKSVWEKSRIPNFFAYHTYLDSIKMSEKYKTYNRNDTSMIWNYGNQTDYKRFCFSIRVEDTCNQIGKYANSHCSMVLKDTIFETYHVTLNWLAYDWWNADLSHYNVYRKDSPGGSFKKISSVKSNRQTYTDSFLCDQDYWYYVEAVHQNGYYTSNSNIIKSHPIYVKPVYTVQTTLVTVENDAYTRIHWTPYPQYFRQYKYTVERSIAGASTGFGPIGTFTRLYTTDNAADVHNRVNYYRVKFQDHCGEFSAPGVVSNSIWLQSASANRNNTALIWNPYALWFCGIKQYQVQLKDDNGVFQTFKTLPPGALRLDSIDIEKLGLDSICFRVLAIKDSTTLDSSFSNELCLIPSSYVIVPNSFTPDDNGLNEIFKPVAGFIHRYSDDPNARFEFLIYNRWGQEVFRSNDASVGWNGYFQGRLCPPGMYIYTLKALGYDGVSHLKKGTVLLLR